MADWLTPELLAVLDQMRGKAPLDARKLAQAADVFERLLRQDEPRARKRFGKLIKACIITHQLAVLVDEGIPRDRALEDLAAHWRKVDKPKFPSGDALDRWLRNHNGWKRWGGKD